MYVDRRKRARILEDHSATIVEMKDRSSESRQWIAIRIEDPISIHSKVNVQNAAIGEMHELVLSATLDVLDASAAQGLHGPSR